MKKRLMLIILLCSSSPIILCEIYTYDDEQTYTTFEQDIDVDDFSYDELDKMADQMTEYEVGSSYKPPYWVKKIGVTLLLQYVALQEFLNNSWQRCKQLLQTICIMKNE